MPALSRLITWIAGCLARQALAIASAVVSCAILWRNREIVELGHRVRLRPESDPPRLMASAWLIRRFIDSEATFKFVTTKQYEPKEGEVRFDMFDAEFTHDGDRCTFEVLVDRTRHHDPALRAIADVVHDIDLKDTKFDRPETAGIAVLVAGIAMAHRDDEERISRAAAVLEDLYVYYQKKR